jgi:type I restriction enzyme S subunit
MNKISLGQIAKVISKGTTPTSVGLSFTNKGIPFLRGEDIQGFQINEKNVKFYIDETSHKKLSRSEIRFGDVLVTIAGTIGRVSYVSSDIIANCNQAVAFIRLDLNSIDPLWLTLLLQSPEYQNMFAKFVAGGAIPNVSLQQIGTIEIPVIPLIEQQEYSLEIIKQIKELEKAKEATEIINQDIKRLKHLTLHDFLSKFNEIEKFKLGEKAVTTSGSTPSRGQKDYWQPAEIPWIKTGEIAFAPITKSEEYVSAKALKECSLKLLPENSVLIAMYGQGKTRGQSAILKVPATINQACFAILPNETWDPEFLQLWLMYSYQDMRNMSENRGGNQANLNGDLLNSFEVPAPSLEVQQEVVIKINASLTELEIMKASWVNTAEEIKTLPNRLLAQAFNGIEND